jgi:hypothetical protein
MASETIQTQFETPNRRWMRLVLILLGGLLIGFAASLPLAVSWPFPNGLSGCFDDIFLLRLAGKFFALPCMPTSLFVQPLVWSSFIAAGALFGLLARQLAVTGSRIFVAATGGISFFVTVYLGAQVVTRLPNPELPIQLESSFGFPFAIMSFGVSFLFALAIGLTLHTSGWLWKAFAAALVTGICYWLVVWILHGHAIMLLNQDATTRPLADSLPSFGRLLGPMTKTVVISNFIAGTIGGWTTLVLLSKHRPFSNK